MIPKWAKWTGGIFLGMYAVGLIFDPAPKTAKSSNDWSSLSSPDDAIRSTAIDSLGDTEIPGISYEGVRTDVYIDPDANVPQPTGIWDGPIEKAPKGSRDISVSYHLSEAPNSDEDEAKFAAGVMQKVFSLNQSYWRVSIDFNGP